MSTLFDNNGACFSSCRRYRYSLWRIWDLSKPLIMFIGLNPSKADEVKPDPTISRVKTFAYNWGYGGFYMMNLFPYVSTDPDDMVAFYNTNLHRVHDLVNQSELLAVKSKCEAVVFAWGNFKVAMAKANEIAAYFPNAKALIINKNGSPRHPLYVKGDVVPVIFKSMQ